MGEARVGLGDLEAQQEDRAGLCNGMGAGGAGHHVLSGLPFLHVQWVSC